MVAKGLWRAGWEGRWAQKKKEPSLPATPTPLVQLPRWRCYSGQRAPGEWGCCLLEVKPCLTEHPSVSGQLFTGLPPPCPTPTQALGRGTALTDSNSPGAGASEIGIEDGLRRERMRVYINLCWVGSQPQEPTGEKAPAPARGVRASTVSSLPARPHSLGLCLGNSGQTQRSLDQRPQESCEIPRLQTVLSYIPKVRGTPKAAANLQVPSLPCQTQSWCYSD